MPTPYDYEAFWTKAKVFLNRAMDSGVLRSFDEQAFWASAALELLGKAALAKVSPLLISEPTEDGANLLIATGLIDGTAWFKSVSASTIFKRCQLAFKPFRAGDAEKISGPRNEYLHGAAIGFMPLDPDKWWPRYWSLAVILITAQDRTIEDLVGADREAEVEAFLERNRKNVAERTEALVQRARQRLGLVQSGTLQEKELTLWRSEVDLTIGHRYRELEPCPSCGEQGVLEGDEPYDIEVRSEPTGQDDDYWDYWAEANVPVDRFSCSNCHLVLDRFELVVQAGLRESFVVADESLLERIEREAEYGND
jgi:hypothetical protein